MARVLEYDLMMSKCETDSLGGGGGERRRFDLFSSTT